MNWITKIKQALKRSRMPEKAPDPDKPTPSTPEGNEGVKIAAVDPGKSSPCPDIFMSSLLLNMELERAVREAKERDRKRLELMSPEKRELELRLREIEAQRSIADAIRNKR